MKKTLPTSFKLMGRTIRVKYVASPNTASHGEFDADKDEITIFVPAESQNLRGHTFYHELVHAILTMMGQEKLNKDEAFVDMFGGLLWQFMRTYRGRLPG